MGNGLTCQNCGAALAPGAAFCESCGKRVERVEAQASFTPAGDRKPEESVQAAPACPPSPFVLAAALPLAMQVGRRSLIHLRFRARADIYESVEFVLRNGDCELARTPCCPGRPFVVEHQVSLSVTPSVCGAARVALDVVCRFGDGCDEEVHTAALDIAVDDRRQTSFSPVFNINQTQTSDRAGDTRGGDVNVNLGGLKLSVEEDATRYATPSSFAPLGVSLRKSPARLTLSGGTEVVQLLSDDVVSFGRNRDNVIPLRSFGADGTMQSDASKCISRFHFRLSRTDRDCLVMDGGCPPEQNGAAAVSPSAYGTRVDGERMPPAGVCRVEAGREVVVGVGREDMELRLRLRFLRDSWGRPSGAVVDRDDGANMRVCVAWREVRLGTESVLWNGSHWAMAVGSEGTSQIAIGTLVTIGGKTFEVQPFHKTHLN